ncbi:MAG: hypothetical protein ACXVZI_10405 [Terriglobales bacterium]
MKKLLIGLLCMGIAIPAATQSSSKPSAARAGARPATEQAPAPAETAMIAAPPAADITATPAATTSVDPMAVLTVGTAVKMKLETRISTRTNKAGDRFSGRVTEAVTLRGRTIIPVGAGLEGRVAHVSEPRRIRGTPTIDLRPDTITMPNGDRYSFSAVVVDTDARPDVDVNDEGKLKGRGHDGKDWKETGVAAGAGALGGGLIAGGEGALIGAGVGATASVVHWLIKTRSAELPSGTEIIMELSRPMSLSNSSAGQ